MKSRVKIQFAAVIILLIGLTACKKNVVSDPVTLTSYSVFAWNDLGMHCLNPSYDKLVILPPFNNLIVQVVKRGNPPAIITSGINVTYKLTNNTYSYGKRQYGGFWNNSLKLFGVTLAHDIGLKGNGLSGNMVVSGNHYIAEGIPVVPVDDNNVFSPFQVAEITVRDQAGALLGQTKATVPTSDEINCAKCHGTTDPFTDILTKHDAKFATRLLASQPVLCASCHPSPALGINSGPQMYLSQALHGSHSSRAGIGCYDCHPGAYSGS
jgi:hypothetical protein